MTKTFKNRNTLTNVDSHNASLFENEIHPSFFFQKNFHSSVEQFVVALQIHQQVLLYGHGG